MHKNLLVELLVEELPPKSLKKLGESFAASFSASLRSRHRAWLRILRSRRLPRRAALPCT